MDTIQFHWYDFFGAVGDALIIGSYLLLQMDKLKSTSFFYSAANGIGATLILISLIYDFNFAAFIIEAFWIAISIYGIWNYTKKKKAGNNLC